MFLFHFSGPRISNPAAKFGHGWLAGKCGKATALVKNCIYYQGKVTADR
jgi:hypothetical protein